MHSIDISNIETLVYLYANPYGGIIEMEIEDPKTFSVRPDGGHEIVEFGGVVTIMPPGWMRIEVFPNRA
jgi:hypothetical protein